MLSRFDDLVRIEAGTGYDLRSFTAHIAFLTTRSLFFRKALSGAWKEAEERVVKLPEDESNIVELYLQCVYGLPISVEPNPVPENHLGYSERLELAKLYVFAEKVQDVRAKNIALKTFLKCVWKLWRDGSWCDPGEQVVHILYEGTVSGSPMRRLLVDIYAHAITSPVAFRTDYPYPNEFLADIVTELTKTRLGCFSQNPRLRSGHSAGNYLEEEEAVNN
jgi:hypothetical protein